TRPTSDADTHDGSTQLRPRVARGPRVMANTRRCSPASAVSTLCIISSAACSMLMMLAPGTGVYALPPEDELVGTLSGETGQPGADAGEVRRGEVDEVPLPGLLVDVPRGGALPPAPDRRDDVGDAAELGVDAVSHGDGRLEAGVVADDGPDVLGSGD